MKKCTYCGKEYGDVADKCAIDGQPLVGAGDSEVAPPLLRPQSVPPLLPGAAAAPPMLNTFSELEQKVMAGGRFVVFQYCFSILVMSFKRSSDIIYLPPGEDGAGAAVSNSLISLIAGWWGIPWGPIWTIATVVKNADGGIEVTQALLAQQTGPARAAQIMARRRIVPARCRGLRNFRIGLVGAMVLLPLLAMALFFFAALSGTSARTNQGMAPEQARTSHPGGRAALGETQFRAANELINGNQGFVGCGNSPKAVDIAVDFSKKVKKRREFLFETARPSRISVGTADFVSCCELYDSQCAIIVNVPDLRQFNSEAKASLGSLVWHTAQEVLNQNGQARPGMKLAVGIRGVLLYDRVLIGNVVTNLDGADTGLLETITSSEPQQGLYPFFEKPTATMVSDGEKENPIPQSVTQTNQ